jgi:Zn-dependent peptidase ImmA (M78 family)
VDFKKFQKIISNNKKNKELVNNKLKEFYNEANMENEDDLLDIMQIARTVISKKGYLIAEIPFKDIEIGAICFSGDGSKYVLLNSALPRVNVNFSLCHEIYHVLYQDYFFKEPFELYMNENYYDHEEEMIANRFAASLMMPKSKFIKMFNKFEQESEENKPELQIIVKLMNYFTAPYMAVLIRCYELELFKDGDSLKRLLNITGEQISDEFDVLWLNTELLKASENDDFEKLFELVNKKGEYLVSRELIRKTELEKIKNNIKKLYQEIRG